jgi:hypothetical protein
MANTNGSAQTPAEDKISALDGARKRFDAREKPASEKDIKAAFNAYFTTDSEIAALQDKLKDLMAKRTEQCKEIVALRGSGQINIKDKGVGRFMARGDSTWITFPSADAGPALAL